MCVRTLTGNEEGELITHSDSKRNLTTKLQRNNGLIRAKEKYIKMYERILDKEKKLSRDQEEADHPINSDVMELADGILKITTIYYNLLLKKLKKYYETMCHSKVFKILFHTTQPSHIIMIAAVLFVTSAIVPMKERVQVTGYSHSRMISFIYLASFVMHFGAQIWMTFVSGLSLYFALPRHTFGEVQRVLFPKYFTINTCLSLITLLIFVKHHPIHTWDTEIAIQVGGMSVAFFLELLIRLYLTPPLLQLMVLKNNLERTAGVGNEIGRHNPGSLKHCPHYLKIHQAFRRVHVCIAIGNMLTMACTVLHLHYIASKLCIL